MCYQQSYLGIFFLIVSHCKILYWLFLFVDVFTFCYLRNNLVVDVDPGAMYMTHDHLSGSCFVVQAVREE